MTLNQVADEIKQFANSHALLNSVVYNNLADWLDSSDKVYPLFIFEFKDARHEGKDLAFNFTAWVVDQVTPEEHNEGEVWSDSILTACDLLSHLSDDDAPFALSESSPIRPLSGVTPDLLSGVSVDFTLKVPFPYDRCNIPFKEKQIVSESGKTLLSEDNKTIKTQ